MPNNRLRTLSPFRNYVRLLPIIFNVLVNIQMGLVKHTLMLKIQLSTYLDLTYMLISFHYIKKSISINFFFVNKIQLIIVPEIYTTSMYIQRQVKNEEKIS